jgi:prolyl-tRNA synthetase
MLAVHGDDNGAVLPPQVAPIQVVIVLIPSKEMGKQINEACQTVATKLKKAGIRTELDLRTNLTPGFKFYYWELRGVPIRIEIGPTDVKQKEVTVVRRDTFERQTIKTERLVATIKKLMKTMTEEMRRKAWDWMNQHAYRVNSLEEAQRLLRRRAGIVEAPWCGNAECGHKFEEEVNARVLGTPVDLKQKAKEKENCVVCGKKAKDFVRTAVAY